MGHNRLGRLPKTQQWLELVALLETAPERVPTVAGQALTAADDRLRQLADDPALTYCFWLLTRVTWASRSADFADQLADLGVAVQPDDSALTFVAQLADHVRGVDAQDTGSGHFGELAALALRRALAETVGQQGASFLGSSVEDVRLAFQAHASKDRFGAVARRFFADFMARSLRSFVDRALVQHVGPNQRIANVAQSAEFIAALDLHTRQSARIVESFAADWYSKHNWQSQGQISQGEARGFMNHALRKLRSELKEDMLPHASRLLREPAS